MEQNDPAGEILCLKSAKEMFSGSNVPAGIPEPIIKAHLVLIDDLIARCERQLGTK
jgi:hypothetical protein